MFFCAKLKNKRRESKIVVEKYPQANHKFLAFVDKF